MSSSAGLFTVLTNPTSDISSFFYASLAAEISTMSLFSDLWVDQMITSTKLLESVSIESGGDFPISDSLS